MKAAKFVCPVCLLLQLVLTQCGNHNLSNKNQAPPHFKHGRELVAHLDQNFGLLQVLVPGEPDFNESAILINEQIRKTIERIKSPKLLKEVHKSYRYKANDFLFTLSDDGNLGVFSWDSRIDDAFPPTKNIALYTRRKKVVPTSLYGKPLFYHQIHTVETNSKPIYLFHGKDQAQKNGSSFRLDAYKVYGNGLELAKVFPNRQSSIKSQVDFDIEMDGSLILKPDVWGTTIVYRPLELYNHLQKSNYIEASSTINQKMESNKFAPQNTLSFLNGSEMPSIKTEGIKKSFEFGDQLRITSVAYEEQNSIKFTLVDQKGTKTQIPWKGKINLVGKKNGFLFFSEETDSGNNKIHLYDLGEMRVRWTKPMAKALIKEDVLLFAEQMESYLTPNLNEIECGPSVGVDRRYFKVYTVKYGDEHPIVEFTNQIFCGTAGARNVAGL